MNLKNSHNDMAMFPFFVDVIHNQSKSIKTFSRHPQIKCGYNCSGINKSKKNMAFHGLADHGWDYLIIELLSTRKANLATLTKYKAS
jgi:hypothetical protein